MQFLLEQKVGKCIAAVFDVIQSLRVFRARHLIYSLVKLKSISIGTPFNEEGNRFIGACYPLATVRMIAKYALLRCAVTADRHYDVVCISTDLVMTCTVCAVNVHGKCPSL